jgi:hypothetical protein
MVIPGIPVGVGVGVGVLVGGQITRLTVVQLIAGIRNRITGIHKYRFIAVAPWEAGMMDGFLFGEHACGGPFESQIPIIVGANIRRQSFRISWRGWGCRPAPPIADGLPMEIIPKKRWGRKTLPITSADPEEYG